MRNPAWVVAILTLAASLSGCSEPTLEAEPYNLREHPEDWNLVQAVGISPYKSQGTYSFKLEFNEWNRDNAGDLWFRLARHAQSEDENETVLFDEWTPATPDRFDECKPRMTYGFCIEVIKRLVGEERQCEHGAFIGKTTCTHDLTMVVLLPNGTAYWGGREVIF